MPKLLIDGKEYEVGEGRNCLEGILDNGLDLPYFCYHSALGSVGSCRLCAVKTYKDEDDKDGRIIMSCMEPVADGKRISIEDPQAAALRKMVVELLMINHPHDCPVCDEGGECHLQDMTVMTGHRTRRHRGPKQTHANQYLGPLINHEMNRCIQCYRCVRYYQDYAGGHDLVVMRQHNDVYFGRTEDGVLENPFAGNLIDICPTGVFTDKTFRSNYTRKWDQATAPSICTQCSVGCNTIPGARYGELRRVLPRYNEEVNGYFICDRGRFGFGFNNSDDRLREPQIQKGGSHHVDDRQAAWQIIQDFCRDEAPVVGIGSPRASLEANYALMQLVGEENFSNGLSGVQHELVNVGATIYQQENITTPTLPDIESADAIFVIGCDVTNEIPRHDLSIRQAVKKGASLWIASSRGTALDAVATARQSLTPTELLHATESITAGTGAKDSFEAQVTSALQAATRPLIIVGFNHGLSALLQQAGQLTQTLTDQGKQARFLIAFPEANTLGIGLIGGHSVADILTRIETGKSQRLIVLENDLLDRIDDGKSLQAAHAKLDRLLVLDHSESVLTSLATEVIPVATPTESNGTWVNAEGRAGRAFQVYLPEPWVPQAWEVLRDLPNRSGETRSALWPHPEDVLTDLAERKPVFRPALEIAPPALFKLHGQKIGRLSHRFSGRTAMPDIRDVREHLRPPEDDETPLSFSMEGSPEEPPSSLIPRFWAPGWNSQEAINKFQIELGRGLHGGPAGKRLIESNGDSEKIPLNPPLSKGETPTSKKGEILLIPAAEIFGSESTSRESASIAELAPDAYLDLHPDTAAQLNLKAGDVPTVSWQQQSAELRVRLDASVPLDTGIIPAGYPETRHVLQPVAARLESHS